MDKKQQEKIKEMFAGRDCSLFETDPEFTELFLEFSQGEVPEKSRLTEKERMLCILSVLLGCQGKGEFRHVLHGALNTGLDPIAVKEVLYQGTAYLGIGWTYDFLEIANQVMNDCINLDTQYGGMKRLWSLILFWSPMISAERP